jgi:hypothetical protein
VGTTNRPPANRKGVGLGAVDQPVLSLAEQRALRRDRAELEELRALGVDCLEHAPERRVSFASTAARLEARRQFGAEFLRACRGFPELSSPVDGPHRPTTLDDLIEVEWRLRGAA